MPNRSCGELLLTRATLVLVLISVMSDGCAHWSQKSKDGPITITSTSSDEASLVQEFKAGSGVAPYAAPPKSGEKNFQGQVEWLTCKGKTSLGTVLVMNDGSAYEARDFCSDWIAQAFLSQGFAVAAFNRPGFGRSTGSQDFVGQSTLAAISEGIKAAQVAESLPRIVGAYGYGLGAIAAALTTKRVKEIKFLVLGGGIYDLEDTLRQSADVELKNQIAKLQKGEGDPAIEERSIAYDIAGLPKKILVYHGKLDVTVPPAQAKAFSDSLEASGEYQVTMQMIEGLSHDVPPQHHRKILEVLLVSTRGEL